MTEKFTDPEKFANKIQRHYKYFTEDLRPIKVETSIGITVKLDIELSGKETLYTISATATLGKIPFAKYHDKEPRRHDNTEDGRFDEEKETKEFIKELAGILAKRNLQTEINGLEIKLS